MRKVLMASAVAFLALAAVPATAMPIAPTTDALSGVTPVAWGCGPGWTRGPYGGCHPIAPAYGFYARPAYGFYARPYYAPYAFYGRRCWWRAGVRFCN
jgi:hypothetical protein